MHSLNTDNRSKRIKRVLCKYYPKFIKTLKKHPNQFDTRKFLVLLYDCVPNIKRYSTDRLVKNVNVLQEGTGKIPTTLDTLIIS